VHSLKGIASSRLRRTVLRTLCWNTPLDAVSRHGMTNKKGGSLYTAVIASRGPHPNPLLKERELPSPLSAPPVIARSPDSSRRRSNLQVIPLAVDKKSAWSPRDCFLHATGCRVKARHDKRAAFSTLLSLRGAPIYRGDQAISSGYCLQVDQMTASFPRDCFASLRRSAWANHDLPMVIPVPPLSFPSRLSAG